MPKSNLLATKLHRSSLPAKWVQRPRLSQRLNEGLEINRQITLVSTPAGFGKTTCISEWVITLDRWSVAWLSLDPVDDDPGRFFAYFVAALQQVDANLGQEIEGVLHSGQLPPSEIISTTLINDIDIVELEGQLLLVLAAMVLAGTAFIAFGSMIAAFSSQADIAGYVFFFTINLSGQFPARNDARLAQLNYAPAPNLDGH